MNNQFKNKKLLVLGGKPMGSCEIVEYAKKLGLYTIVADYLPVESSPAKAIADEHWNVSTGNLDLLAEIAKKHRIDGVVASVHEFNIEMSLKLSEILGLPNYCTVEQWQKSANKASFKQLCRESGLPVAKEYHLSLEDLKSNKSNDILFPVITKPVDSSGSRGFTICRNQEELFIGYHKALEFSESKRVLIEEYIEHESIVAIYTVHNGEILFSGIQDKYPKRFESSGSYIGGLHLYPSIYTDEFINKIENKIELFIKNFSLNNGFLWFEVFVSNGHFIFNEMGLRFGGTMTQYPVSYLFNYNQLQQYIALSLKSTPLYNINADDLISKKMKRGLKYCTLPIQIHPGTIVEIEGIKELHENPVVVLLAQLKHKGDIIENWGSGQQVFGYLHVVYSDTEELRKTLRQALDTVKVLDSDGFNMLFTLFDIDNDTIKS